MSPAHCASPAPAAVAAAVARLWVELGSQVRRTRLDRRLSTFELAARAGVSRTSLYTIERGEPVSIEVAARIAGALGLRLGLEMVDPRQGRHGATRQRDLVHFAMGDFEAGHLRRLRLPVGLDEPYQHYQFAGRADLVAWDIDVQALLHIENRTGFPDFQDMAGAYNAKRAYLPRALADRLGIGGWRSETHVIVGLWSSEVLHLLRLRTHSFRSLCPDPASAFDAWWRGRPPTTGRVSTLVVLDPLATGRQRAFVSLDAALVVRPRYRGYPDAARAVSRSTTGAVSRSTTGAVSRSTTGAVSRG
jgi:transcriptional regulator with XRE-family HTH domain